MTAVALIGGDGAGKSSIARELARSFPRDVKLLYMGMNPESGRFALPTTRFVHALKRRRVRRRDPAAASAGRSLHSIEHRRDERGRLWAAARLANRICEESVRQCVSWWYQARGAIVVYDRHYLFDFTPTSDRPQRLSSRLHLWFLEHVYPKPDLVILLDAPPDVLVARKSEVPASYLESRRRAFLKRGATLPNFVVVDSDRPFDRVYDDVAQQITSLVTGLDDPSRGRHIP